MPVSKKEQPTIETIKILFTSINNKSKLADEILKAFPKVKKPTILSRWLSPYYGFAIPKDNQETVLRILSKTLNEQNNDNN